MKYPNLIGTCYELLEMVKCGNDRKTILSDVTGGEWALVAPYLTLTKEDAPQRDEDLREVFNDVRLLVRSDTKRPAASTYQKPRKGLCCCRDDG